MFDKYREACEQLSLRQADAQQIRSGATQRAPAPRHFDDLADYWLANRAAVKRSAKDDQSIVRQLRAEFGTTLLSKLTATEVDNYARTKRHLSPKTLRNHLTLLQTMLRKAHDLGWLLAVPRVDKPRVPIFRTDYRFLRSDSEIRQLLKSARSHSELAYVLYACAIYTGARKGELARLQWSDVDLSRRLITIQRSFNGPTKAGRVRYVPILDPLRPILQHWATRRHGDWVFVGARGEPLGTTARIFEETLHEILKGAGFPHQRKRGVMKPYVTFHDLRHTFASSWVMAGGDIFKLKKILGHASIDMTMRYAHLQPNAFAADYGRLGGASLHVAQPVELER